MKLFSVAIFILIACTAIAGAQTALPFSTQAHAFKLTNGCIGLTLRLETRGAAPPPEQPSTWRETVIGLAAAARAALTFDMLEIDLRRGDESQRPRDESGLAHFLDTRRAECSEFYVLKVARRLLTDQDFNLRDSYQILSRSGISETSIEKFLSKELKLPRNWRLPGADFRSERIRENNEVFNLDKSDASLAIAAAKEALAKTR